MALVRRSWFLTFFLTGIVACWSPAARAADEPAPKAEPPAAAKPATPPTATPAPKPATVEKVEKREGPPRQQDIYIPYDKLRQVFEKHGRGVFLPYEDFQELWKAAQHQTQPAAEARPPLGALITEIENEATVSKDVVQVKAHLKIDLLAEGWHEVPLRLADAAIASDKIGDQTARILGGAGEDHRLLIEKKGKQPEQIELVMEYARAITRTPGQNSVAFQAPQAPVNRWRVRIPQSGVKVNIQPLIAATEVPAETPKAPAKAGTPTPPPKGGITNVTEETVLLAFVGPAPTVRIDWTPKAEGAVGLTALASVQTQQEVWLHEGQVRIRAELVYSISRAELSQLAIEVPADYQVVNVIDANVRQWSVDGRMGIPARREAADAGAKPDAKDDGRELAADKKDDGRERPSYKTVNVQLAEPVKGEQKITIELEKLTGGKQEGAKGATALKVPVVKALNVGRQQGFVVVRVAPEIEAEAGRTTGLTQIESARLPEPLNKTPWTLSYQYAAVPFELDLNLKVVEPRITADSLVEARLEPERLTLESTTVLNIERAGVFKLDLDVPEGFEIRRVEGREVPGDETHKAIAAPVDSHREEGEKKTHMVVNLSRKTIGRVGIVIELQKELHEPALLVPGDKPASLPLVLPVVPKATVERTTGKLLISAPESLKVEAKATGMREVSFREATVGIPPVTPVSVPTTPPPNNPTAPRTASRPVLAFAFTQEPGSLQLKAERRKPQVTMRQVLVARIEEGVIKYQATFQHNILYSGVKSLRIDVPADVAPLLRNNTRTIHDRHLDPQPADVPKDCVAWSFSGDSELTGQGDIDLTWEKKIDRLEVGKSISIVVPRLAPHGADHSWGQIALVKAEMLDVHEAGEPEGLLPKDPQHDLVVKVPGAARAFEFQGDWSLPITITRYELEEVKRTSIDRALVRMVMTPAGEISVQALYRVRSARQNLRVGLPEKAEFDTTPLRINGQAVDLQGQKPDYFIPLPATSADEPFLLELRYTTPGGGRLDLPTFPEEDSASRDSRSREPSGTGPTGTASSDETRSDVAIQKVYLCAFVPQTQALLGSRGPWSEEFRWTVEDASLAWQPHGPSDQGLFNWVCEGLKQPGTTPDSFHPDGQLYVFSTLRPAGSPQGSLHMSTLDRRALSGLIFVAIVLGGLVLLPVRLTGKAVAAGLLVVALVLSGVFLPTFSLQLLNGTLALAVLIVLILWGVMFLVRQRPLLARAAIRPTPPPPPPPVITAAVVAQPEATQTTEGGPSHE